MLKSWVLFGFAALFAIPPCSADILFGRRVYAATGRTYQQIWTLDTRTKRIAPLTNSERRHVQPVCSLDGARIWFLSGAFGDETNSELWSYDRRTRTEKLAVRFTGRIVRLLGGSGPQVFFTAYEADLPALYRWDGSLVKLSPVVPSPFDAVSLSPDGRSLAVQTGEHESVMMEASGAAGRKLANCSAPVFSPDGRKLACIAGKTIRIENLATGVEAARIEFNERATPPSVADFSPDGWHLLVKTIGANHNSTYPQSDYWVYEAASEKWTFAGPGQSAIFASGGGVLLSTPRELLPLDKAHEWVSQMLLVDLATHAQTPVTTGTAMNVEPCRCVDTAPPARAAKKAAAPPAKKTRKPRPSH